MRKPIIKVLFQHGPLPWRVETSIDHPYPNMSIRSKEQAVSTARQLAKSVQGVLKIQGLDGKFSETYTYGPTAQTARKN
jgi:hypothetical protein